MVVKVFLDARRRMVVHGKPFVIVFRYPPIQGPWHSSTLCRLFRLIHVGATPSHSSSLLLLLRRIRRFAVPHRHSQRSAVRIPVPTTSTRGRERSVPTRTGSAATGGPTAAAGSPAPNQPEGRHAAGSGEVPSSWSHPEASHAQQRVRSKPGGKASGGDSTPNCRRLGCRRVASLRTTCESRASCRRRSLSSRLCECACAARMPAAVAVGSASCRHTSARR